MNLFKKAGVEIAEAAEEKVLEDFNAKKEKFLDILPTIITVLALGIGFLGAFRGEKEGVKYSMNPMAPVVINIYNRNSD